MTPSGMNVTMLPISHLDTSYSPRVIRYVLMDIDDTLTPAGQIARFPPITALWRSPQGRPVVFLLPDAPCRLVRP
jgi:hypothetical protein